MKRFVFAAFLLLVVGTNAHAFDEGGRTWSNDIGVGCHDAAKTLVTASIVCTVVYAAMIINRSLKSSGVDIPILNYYFPEKSKA